MKAVAIGLLAASIGLSACDDEGSELPNANHIFNAIHSSMRQWGSGWFPNGMSLFPAIVPAGTQFYHGTAGPATVTGMEWLALEPEHAMNFARAELKDPPYRMSSSHLHQGDARKGAGEPSSWLDQSQQSTLGRAIGENQESARASDTARPKPPGDWAPGYLHTYRTKHPLSLLYIDGMSAGKTSTGTLDMQDIFLLNGSLPEDSPGGHGFNEINRGRGLCSLARDRWHGKIHGFIRMEAGFEIILCDFGAHLLHVRSARAPDHAKGSDRVVSQTWSWLTAISARYRGIGGRRVTLDYNNFLTAYAFDLKLFHYGKRETVQHQPRLSHIAMSELHPMHQALDDLVNGWAPGTSSDRADYQAIADEIVERYTKPLAWLRSAQNATIVQREVKRLLQPYINHDSQIPAETVGACTQHFLPHISETHSMSSLAYNATRSVAFRICHTLTAIASRPESASPSISRIQRSLTELITWLNWSTWRGCPVKCAADELCVIPVWPLYWHDDIQGGRNAGLGTCMNETTYAGRVRHGPRSLFPH